MQAPLIFGPGASQGKPIYQIISYIEADKMLDYLRPVGLDLTKVNFRMSSSSQLVALEMARRGLGMIIAPDWIAQGHSELVPVMGEVGAFSVPTWLVTHSEMKISRRIRLVFDHMADKLS